MRSGAQLELIHRFCGQHRELLARSERAGCFYCRRFFDPREIEEWVDAPRGEAGEAAGAAEGVTALCPRCGIDAVLPSAAPIRLDEELLAEMHRHWFSTRR